MSHYPDLIILPNQVHLWYISYNIHFIDKTFLVKNELDRASAFRFDVHQNQFLMYRCALRHILAAYYRIAPQNLVISYNRYGKPYLSDNRLNLEFNLSHSSDMAILAITQKNAIGVDIEQIKPFDNVENLVNRYFSMAEQKLFHLIPSKKKLESFYEIWTRKEAYIKAIGKGLSFPLDHITVSFCDDYPPRIISIESSAEEAIYWSMHSLNHQNDGEEYKIACAIHNEMSAVVRFDYNEITKNYCNSSDIDCLSINF